MKSSYVLILLIIGIIVLHALDDRKDHKTESKVQNAVMAEPRSSKAVSDKPSIRVYN